jgi:hypothetical protein
MRRDRGDGREKDVDFSGEESRHRLPCASIGHVQHIHAGHALEQLPINMRRTADAQRSNGKLPGSGFGIGDELGHRCGPDRRMYNKNSSGAGDARNRHQIANEIEFEIFVEGCIPGVAAGGMQKGISVRCGSHDGLGRQIAGGAGSIINDELLSKPVGQPLGHQPGVNIVVTAGWITDEDAYRPIRVDLRRDQGRNDREHRGTHCRPGWSVWQTPYSGRV